MNTPEPDLRGHRPVLKWVVVAALLALLVLIGLMTLPRFKRAPQLNSTVVRGTHTVSVSQSRTNRNRQGTIVAIAGRVEVCRAGSQQWLPASTNLVLYPADKVQTAPDGRATVQLADGTVLNLNALSTLCLVAPKRTLLQMLKGAVGFLTPGKTNGPPRSPVRAVTITG